MSDEPTKDWRSLWAYYNGQTIALITCSGSGNRGPDDTGPVCFLPANVSNRSIGEAAQDCLAKSRFLLSAEWKVFFAKDELKRKEAWVEKTLTEGMDAKNYSALKKRLMLVTIDKVDELSLSAYADKIKPKFGDNMSIHPTKNKNGKSWDNTSDYYGSAINLRYPCPPAELGSLLREAFRRCEGVGRDEIEFPEPLPD